MELKHSVFSIGTRTSGTKRRPLKQLSHRIVMSNGREIRRALYPRRSSYCRVRKIIQILGAYSLIASIAMAESISPFHLDYKITLGGLKIGTATSRLFRDASGTYIYQRVAKSNGWARLLVSDSIVERSEWRMYENKPRPLRFEYTELDGSKEKSETISFNWDKKLALVSRDGHPPKNLEIRSDSLDRLTMEIQILLDVRSEVRTYDYSLVDEGRVKHRRFVPVGYEQIVTPAGTFDTVKYWLETDSQKNSETLFWLAPSLGYLFARMEYHNKKKHFVIVFQLTNVRLSSSLNTPQSSWWLEGAGALQRQARKEIAYQEYLR